MATRTFPFRSIPICGAKGCGEPCTRGLVQNAQHRDRPYYYCQRGHPRYFATWDDSFGIEPGNPECRCRFLSRRERQRGPVLKEWFSCATKECSFREDIGLGDEHVAKQVQARVYNVDHTWGTRSQTMTLPEPMSRPTAGRHETATDMATMQQAFDTLNVGVNVTQRHETSAHPAYRQYICDGCLEHNRRTTLSKMFRRRRCTCY